MQMVRNHHIFFCLSLFVGGFERRDKIWMGNFPTTIFKLGDLGKIKLAKHWITVNAYTMIAMGNFFLNSCLWCNFDVHVRPFAAALFYAYEWKSTFQERQWMARFEKTHQKFETKRQNCDLKKPKKILKIIKQTWSVHWRINKLF